jgi:hypothetical protein
MKKKYANIDQNTLSKCIKCHRTHTLHMMIQVNTWANRYTCVKCFNLAKERVPFVYNVRLKKIEYIEIEKSGVKANWWKKIPHKIEKENNA